MRPSSLRPFLVLISQVLGKAEGVQSDWHGHITAVTVAPEYRRLSLARNMCQRLEFVSDAVYKGYFVDLYVRCNNASAISMYEGMGYSVYRRVREYYGNLGIGKDGRDEEDAFGASPSLLAFRIVADSWSDMRKPLSRDVLQRSIRTNGRDMIVGAHEVS